MSAMMLGSDRVSVCFFGEGALGQGLLYEEMNIAALWKLPVIYVCENNLYNEYTHYIETTAGQIAERAQSFGIPAQEVDGQDVRAVFLAALELVDHARRGEGPAFLLCNTYRYFGHHVGDINRGYYRSKEEEEDWKTNRDPLQILSSWMRAEHIADTPLLEQIERDVRAEAEDALRFALDAPYPELSEVGEDVYVE
jgi:pyruvate dehydrogenase E1 component alpha subunit